MGLVKAGFLEPKFNSVVIRGAIPIKNFIMGGGAMYRWKSFHPMLLVGLVLVFANAACQSAPALKVSANFEKEILDRHNVLRKKHDASEMTWSKKIQEFAQEWAEKNAREDRMHHRSDHKYGENIYWKSGGRVSGKSVVDAWYSEIKFYKFKNPGFTNGTGHFTQVVWKGSTKLGCGRAKSRKGGIYVVCNYSPPGNFLGRFNKNVLRSR